MPSLFEAYGIEQEELAPPANTKPSKTSRSVLTAANDTVIEGANAFLSGVQGIGNFFSPGNRFSGMVGELIKEGVDKQSEPVRAEKQRYQQEVEAADGVLGEVLPTLGYVARNPVISMAQALGSVAGPGVLVKGLSKGAQAVGLAEKAASRVGLAGGSALGGAMAGGDAAGTAYDLVAQTPISTLAQTPEFQALAAQGMDTLSIVEALAGDAARKASVLPGLAGAASGAVGLERLFAGGKGFAGGALKRGIKTGAVEAVPEALEEGLTTYEGRAAAAQLNPSIDPQKGVGAAATMGGVLGFASGGAIGAISPPSEDGLSAPIPSAGDLIRRNLQPETGALAKAVNAGIEAQAQQADATGVLPGAEPVSEPEPIDDPFRDRITALPEGPKQEALRAYAVVNNPSAPKGVLKYNRGLLDRLLREDEEARAAAAEAEAAAAPLAPPTDTDVTGLLGPVNTDPVSGALQAVQAETVSNENLANWMQRATPYPVERAQELQALAKEQRGLVMAVVPHSSGSGFTVIPAQWVTPAMRNLVGGALPFDNAPTGAIRVNTQGTATPETRPQQLATAAENQRRTDLGLPITTRTTQGVADVSPAAPVGAVDTGLAGPANLDPAGSDGVGALPADDRADGVLPVAGTPAPSSEPGVAVGTALAGNSLTNGEVDGPQADQAQQTETQRPEAPAAVDASINPASDYFRRMREIRRRFEETGDRAAFDAESLAAESARDKAIADQPLKLSLNSFGKGRAPITVRTRSALIEAKKKFSGKQVTNFFDGLPIEIPASGLKNSMPGKVSEGALAAMSNIDELIRTAKFSYSAPDKKGRDTIKEVRFYDRAADLDGQPVNFRVAVRVAEDGRRYYDRFEIVEKAAAGLPGEQALPDSSQPFTATSSPETVTDPNLNALQPDKPSAAEQRQQFKDAEAKRTASGARLRSAAQEANPFRAFLGKHGVSSDVVSDFVPGEVERRKALVSGYGPIFRKSGAQLDQLTQRAVEEGFLVAPDERALSELIERAIRGERVIAQYAEGVAESEGQALIDRQRALEEDAADALGLVPDATVFDMEDDADIQIGGASNVSTEDFLRAMGATEQEIADEIANESRGAEGNLESVDQAEQVATGEAPGNRAQRDSAPGPAAEDLVAPSRADVEAQQDRAARADELDQRAQIDREASGFTLESQTQEARTDNTGDLFGGPSVDDVKAERGRRESPPDFGGPSLFSRESRNELGQFASKTGTIRQIVQVIASRWDNPPGIEVISSLSEAPREVIAEYERQNSQGADGEAEGFYHRGKVYLVASALNTPADVTRVLFHETLGHAGLRGNFDGVLEPILDQIATLRGDLLRPVAEKYGFNLSDRGDRLKAAEEVLAFLAQTKPEIGYVKRAIAAIRTWLRANIPGFAAMKLSDAEIVNNFILPARQFVERGTQKPERTPELQPAFGRREQLAVQLAPAIVGGNLGSASALPMYEAAKAGDVVAAVEVAKALVTPDLTEKVRRAIGTERPVVVPVASVEAAGRNKIPLAAAKVLAKELGLKTADGLVQSNSPKRTALNGLDRIFAQPEFDGQVEPGQSYVLVDDTLTQGATFAALASHIQQNGGRVLASVALTGKTYSATLTPNPETLKRLREKYADLEPQFQAATGFGFDGLTQSEARYLANFEPSQSVRDRIVEAGNQAGYGQNPADAGPVNEPGLPPVFSRTADSAGAQSVAATKTDPKAVLNEALTRTGGATSGVWDGPGPSRFDDFVYKAQDKLIDTKRVMEAIKKTNGQISDDLNVYLQEELFHGRAAKRTEDFGAQELQPLLEQLQSDGLSIGDVEEYLHARHAKEANALIASREPGMPDGGSGMTDKAADDYFAKLSPADTAKLNAVAQQVDAILAKTRQLYADYGLESQATVDGWAQMFKSYVPLMREDKNGSGMGIGQGFSVKGKEVKGRTGSTRKVVDILANIAMQRERVIVRGEKNRVAVALVGLAAANPNGDFWSVGPPPAERVYDPKKDAVVERADPMFKARDNVLVAKVKGANGEVTEQAVVFNEDDPRALRMAASLKNLDAGALEGLLGASAKVTRYFSSINTQYNPVFGIVNLIRDVQGALINLADTPLAGKQAKIAVDTASALRGIYGNLRSGTKNQWSDLWQQFQEDGGQTGYRDLFRTSQDRAEALQRTLTPDAWADGKLGQIFTAGGALKVPMIRAKQSAGWIFDWLSDYNNAMENSVRLASYKSALDQGMSREQAASLAKNLTVNFNRKGQIGQQAGALYAFFNAAMQGTAKMGQVLLQMDGGNPKTLRLSPVGKKVVYGGMLLGATQALALAAAGFDDDDPPEFLRERSLIIPLGDKKYVSIPMPLGLHVIPGLGRHATEFALSGFAKPAKRVVDVIGMFADAFNPVGNAGLSIQTIAPTIIDPLVALKENKDFAGRPIARTSSNPAVPGFTQWKDSATAPAKWLAEAINWVSGGNDYVAGVLSPTPDQIDYLFAQVTGGVGRELSKVENTIKGAVQGEEVASYKVPLLGRFYGNARSQASEGNAFYANNRELNELETQIKAMRKDGKFDEAIELQASRPDAYLIRQANMAERQVQRLRREKREMIESGADRELIRAKEDQITGIMARLNRAVERQRELAEQ